MRKNYSVEQYYDNSWKIKHKGETFANIEGVDKIRDGKQVVKGFFNKKPVVVYRVTNYPGASNEEFLTLHSAATHAIEHHTKNGHIRDDHPIKKIRRSFKELERLIWKSASDPRMVEHQDKLLEVSKAHATAQNTFHHHFKDDIN